MSIQLKGLANGAYLDDASVDVIALAAGTSMDVFGKGGDEFDLVISGDVGKHGVHVMEGFDEAFPMVPIVLPFHVRCCYCTELMNQEEESGKDELEPLKSVLCKVALALFCRFFSLQ